MSVLSTARDITLGVIGIGSLAVAAYAFGTASVPVQATVSVSVAHVGASMGLAPCATEDSTDCYWDARTMGNGEGRSYVVVGENVRYVN